MTKISPEKRRTALYHLQNGMSLRAIGKLLGLGKSTVQRLRNEHAIDVPKQKGGRPKKLKPRHLHFLEKHFELNANSTIKIARQALKDVFQVTVSPTTVRKVLRFKRFKARKMVKKPMLTARHRKLRREFAERHKNWTVEDWKRVIWSDETKINFIGPDGKRFAWVRQAGFSSKLVQPTVKYGGGSIMIWGCMSWEGVGGMLLVIGRMDANQYIEILQEKLLPTISNLRLKHGYNNLIFQQDGDPKHTARKTQKWLKDKGIEVMKWPPQSPDLNPIEHLWYHMKTALSSAYNTIPKSQSELLQRCEATWADIAPQVCQKYIESMPRRIEAVWKAKGGNTKY